MGRFARPSGVLQPIIERPVQRIVRVDEHSRFARGLTSFAYFDSRVDWRNDIVNRRPITPGTNASVTEAGLRQFNVGGGGSSMPLRLTPNPPITVLAIWRHIGGTVDWLIGATWTAYYSTASTSITTSNASDFSGTLSFTLGNYREPDDTLLTVAAFTVRGTNDLRGSANGGPIIADTSMAAPSGVAANAYFGSDNSLTGNKSDSIIRALATWNRAFSDQDLIALSGNPWQVLARTTRRIYLPAAAGGAFTVTIDAGSYVLTGNDVGLKRGERLTIDTGSYALTGNDVALNHGYNVTLETGSYALTGNAVNLTAQRLLTAATGAYTLTGQDVTLTYAPSTDYSLTLDPGAYALTGNDVALKRGLRLALDTGEYLLSGQAVALDYSADEEPVVDLSGGSIFDEMAEQRRRRARQQRLADEAAKRLKIRQTNNALLAIIAAASRRHHGPRVLH